MNTLITLLHPDNWRKVVSALAAIIYIIASYTGTLPAPLAQHKATLDLLAALVVGLNLLHVDPKREL